jgi:outer membrane lipoprotein-sorting protein
MVKSCLAVILALTAFTGIRAQTVDEILSKHFEAIGGKDKIGQIKSISMENSVEFMGNEGPSKITAINNKGYRLETEINNQKIIQVFTDKGGWSVNPMMGSTTPQALPEEMYKQGKEQIDLTGPLYNYASKGNKVELQGKEAGTYKLKVTSSDSVETTFFIDSASYYITKVSKTANMMGQTMEVSSTFSDFKKTDYGLVYPYTIEINYAGNFSLTSKVKKIEINKEVDPKIFDMPKS